MNSNVRQRYQCSVEQKVTPPGECNGNDGGINYNNVYSNNNRDNNNGPSKQPIYSTTIASTAATFSAHDRQEQLLSTSVDVTNRRPLTSSDYDQKECSLHVACDRQTAGLSTRSRNTAQNGMADKTMIEAGSSIGGGGSSSGGSSGGTWAGGSGNGARSKSSSSSSSLSFGRRLNAIVRDRVIFFNQKDKTNGHKSSKTASSDVVTGRGGSKKTVKSFISWKWCSLSLSLSDDHTAVWLDKHHRE